MPFISRMIWLGLILLLQYFILNYIMSMFRSIRFLYAISVMVIIYFRINLKQKFLFIPSKTTTARTHRLRSPANSARRKELRLLGRSADRSRSPPSSALLERRPALDASAMAAGTWTGQGVLHSGRSRRVDNGAMGLEQSDA
jgi:hypothetical protein